MTEPFSPSTPDWGIYPNQVPGAEADLGEVAARLSALSSFRRTGRIVYQNDFITLTGISHNPTDFITTEEGWTGGEPCLKLNSVISKRLPKLMQTIGLEVLLKPEYNSVTHNYPSVTMVDMIDASDAGYRICRIGIEWNINTVSIQDNLLAWHVIFTIPASGQNCFHNLKATVDLSAGTYGYLYWDDEVSNSKAIIPNFVAAPTYGDSFAWAIWNLPVAGQNECTYVSNLLITTNEAIP